MTTTLLSPTPITDDTLNTLFQTSAQRHATRTALRHKVNKVYEDITYGELAARVEAIASALVTLGVEKGDRVAILSENCPEWATLDFAALSLGAIVVPIYPTLPAQQVAYIVRNSGAKLLAVENKKQLAKVRETRETLHTLQYLVSFETVTGEEGDDVLNWEHFLLTGREHPLGAQGHKLHWSQVAPDDVASLVYTSGTTGDPKGAMLTHRNFVWNVDAALAHYAAGGEAVTEADIFLSFLPLSHAYERTCGHFVPLRAGASIGYSEGVRTLADEMAQLHPTIMVCVPRVYEALQARILDTVAKDEPSRQKAFHEALEAGKAYSAKKMAGEHVGLIDSGKHAIFEKLVYSKVRERFGGHMRFFVSAGSALNPDTARFFAALGVPISEGFGMTESSPFMCTNPVHRIKAGTVGTVAPGGEFRFADDGEISYRGPNVMKGYWENEEATRDMIDADGWLRTGDIGQIDEDGYLKITDRKKDLLVLGNGKKVAPQPIETVLKNSPFINEIVLIGDKQSIVTALVLPHLGKLGDWAKTEGLTFADDDALIALPEVRKKIKQEIDAHSKDLAEFEKVKKFTLLNTTFTVETGEMTPTLKIKRKVVMQKYARQIAEMRGGEE